ncbi:MAG: TIGR03013 family XrtA/PEP-CTERM system glycosyltransferase [Pseudomonadota bacterium]
MAVIRIFNHYVSRVALALLLMEVLLLAAAALGALSWLADARQPGHANLYPPALAFALSVVLGMGALGMYRQDVRQPPRGALRMALMRIAPALALAFILLNPLALMLPALQLGHAGQLAFVLGGAGVLLTRLLLLSSVRADLLAERVILVGQGGVARECLELAASRHGARRFQVVGCVPVPGEPLLVPAACLLPEHDSLLALARAHGAAEIIVSLAERRGGAYPARQLLECALGGLRVTDAAAFFEREACQIRIESLQPAYLIFGGGFDQSFLRASVKRAFDLLASAAICLASLPLMLVAAIGIVAEDGGPVFYRQERVGKDGHIFRILKFRSMRCDAEPDGQPRWAAQDDPRVTRIGHWMRQLRIDELPQIFNVFRGDMSFVGPRPERAYFVEQLGRQLACYDIRHSIKPGITGLAQVRYRYGASVDDAACKLQYDLYYVKNNSLFLDLLILIDTVQVVLFSKGGR